MSGRDCGGGEPADHDLPDHDLPDHDLPDHDLDLIADYLAGALAGTPDEAVVAGRIRRDSAWGAAAGALERASTRVTIDLAEWGRAAEPMPSDIADRLAAALSLDVAGTGSTVEPVDEPPGGVSDEPPGGVSDEPAADRHTGGESGLSLVPGGSRRTRSRPWRARWAGPLAAAASVLALGGLGLWMLPQLTDGSEFSSDTAGSAPKMDGSGDAPARGGTESGQTLGTRPGGLAGLPIQRLIASGADYRRDALAAAGRNALGTRPEAVAAPPGYDRDGRGVPPDEVGSELRRLASGPALTACLTAIGDAHPHLAVSVDLVDYASFEGSPALVVIFSDGSDQRWMWAAGPGCGLPGVGADTRFVAKVL